MKPYHETEHGSIFCGDCLEIIPELYIFDGIILTDPPYGIKMSKGFSGSDGFNGNGKSIARKQYDDDWDNERPHIDIFNCLINLNLPTVIFGGNYFTDMLPQANHWAVWDKKNTMPTFSDCELIWTNIKRNSVKCFRHEYNGLIGREKTRFHPTQKPITLIGMVILEYSKDNDNVFDPFAGSGTTAIAALRTNRRYILIEKEEKYCEIAAKRITAELDQTDFLRSEK